MSVLIAVLVLLLAAAVFYRFMPTVALGVLLVLIAVSCVVLGADVWLMLSAVAFVGLLGLPQVSPSRVVRKSGQAPVKKRSAPKEKTVKKEEPSPKKTSIGVVSTSGLDDTYEVMEKVGIGGMATVYKAKSKVDNRIVALKIPQEKYVGDPRFVRRFHREAELLAHLDHPSIVKVFDHGDRGETHFIAMEFLDGEGLDRLIEHRRLSIPVAVQVMARIAEALQHIHGQGIIHRDIKPGNIMVLKNAVKPDETVDSEGVRLMDFGIAAGKVLTRLTITGARIGTPVYMSPEQAKGQRIDHKSDIYSLGVVFYEVLCGVPPFQGAYEAVIHQQITQMPTPPKQSNPDIPQALSDLIYKMLEKDPERRPGLEVVLESLRGSWREDPGLGAPVYLVVGADAKKGTVRLTDLDGTLARMWSGVGSARGMFPSAPLSVSVDADGFFWVTIAEYGGGASRLVHRFSSQGELIKSMATYGMKMGEVMHPSSIAVLPQHVVVLDSETSTLTKFGYDGTVVSRFGGVGQGRGMFESPKVAVAGQNHIFVLDYGNRQVQRLTHDGEYVSRYAFRRNKESQDLRVLGGLAVLPDESILIYDVESQKIRKLSLEGEVQTSLLVPLLEGEDPTAIVEICAIEETVYAARRGSSKIHRLPLSGMVVTPMESYTSIRGLAKWYNIDYKPKA